MKIFFTVHFPTQLCTVFFFALIAREWVVKKVWRIKMKDSICWIVNTVTEMH